MAVTLIAVPSCRRLEMLAMLGIGLTLATAMSAAARGNDRLEGGDGDDLLRAGEGKLVFLLSGDLPAQAWSGDLSSD
jgi:hypothetical protein